MPKNCAIVIADHYYQDKMTGKHIISGTFASLNSEKLPVAIACGVFVAMEDVVTPASFELYLEGPNSGPQVKVAAWKVDSQEGQTGEVVEIGIQLALGFSVHGMHRLIVKTGDTVLGSRPIMVKGE